MNKKNKQTGNEILMEAYRKYTRIMQLALDMACQKIPQEQLRSGNAITEPTVFIRMAREKIDSNAEEDGIIADIGEMNENDG